jgi:hypothetical protein
MTVSALTTPREELIDDVIATLVARGYVRAPLTKSLNHYLAEALGGLTSANVSELTTTRINLFAGISNYLSAGSASGLSASLETISSLIVNNAAVAGPPSLHFNIASNSGLRLLGWN